MNANAKRILVWSVVAIAVAISLTIAFIPRPVTVDLITVIPAPMEVTADEEGETRVHDVFVLSAPVAGRLRRIETHVGDPVLADETVLARIEPADPTFLDPRTEAQARAARQAAASALTLAKARVEEARAEFEYADAEFHRARELIAKGTISIRDAEAAERAYKARRAALSTAQAAVQMRAYELQQAEALLISPAQSRTRTDECDCVDVTAPVSGQVLQIVNPSERIVTAGEALVEIGDPGDLEIVVDFLSADAVQIEPGQRVIIERWGGESPLVGHVRRIEPFGFRKTSALGIEEQRVNVIVDFTSPRNEWSRLGHGYQVDVRVVLWEQSAVLAIPLTALFRDDQQWAVFVDDNGRAALREVVVGHRNGMVAEIISGLAQGDRVVLHPSNRVIDGVRITGRG